MAKIKVTGYNELIDVPDEEARELDRRRATGEVDRNSYIQIGSFKGENSQIKMIIVEEENYVGEDTTDRGIREFFEKRNILLRMSPQERATHSGGHFRLFFFGVYGTEPSEEAVEKAKSAAEEFYVKNREWSKPSMKLWIEFLKLGKDFKMNSHVLRILSSVEGQELYSIESDREYTALRYGENKS